MGFPRVKLAEVAVEAKDEFKTLTSGAKVTLGSQRSLRVKHKHPGNAIAVEASVPGLSAGYDLKSKAVHFEHVRSTKLGRLTVRQRVPHKAWYLVPSPEVKLAVQPKVLNSGKLRSVTTLSYDFQKSSGTIEHVAVLRNKYSAALSADTVKGAAGASLALSYKPTGSRRLTSVGVTLSRSAGPVVKAEAALVPGRRAVRVKAAYKVQARDAQLELLAPPINRKLHLSVASVLHVAQPVKKPTVTLSARLEL